MPPSELEAFGLTDPDFLRLVAGRLRTGEVQHLDQRLLAKYGKRLKAIAGRLAQPPIDARELTEEEAKSVLPEGPPEKPAEYRNEHAVRIMDYTDRNNVPPERKLREWGYKLLDGQLPHDLPKDLKTQRAAMVWVREQLKRYRKGRRAERP
jgi:hypothetical protein